MSNERFLFGVGTNPVKKNLTTTAGTVAVTACAVANVQAILDGNSGFEVAVKPVLVKTGTCSKNSCAAVISDGGVYECNVRSIDYWLAYRTYNGATVASATSANDKLAIERLG